MSSEPGVVACGKPLRVYVKFYVRQQLSISYVETLGYHRLTERERQLLEEFFAVSLVLPISQPVLAQAVTVRQTRRMTLGDAIIAGTALAHDLVLVTRNLDDFQWIERLQLLNPFDA